MRWLTDCDATLDDLRGRRRRTRRVLGGARSPQAPRPQSARETGTWM